jgi:hypothetical protein
MSIVEMIKQALRDGTLLPYLPVRSRRQAKRCLFLTKHAHSQLTDPNSAVNILVGRGMIEAALTKWTLGETVYGDRKGGRFLKRLDPPPPEIWEIRLTEPTVQARLFCRFAEPDALILTHMHTRRYLGDRGSPEWLKSMADCATAWDALFPSSLPFSGKGIADYVTENCNDFPI